MPELSENHKQQITRKLDCLPDFALSETLDFIDFLINKHKVKKLPDLWSSIQYWRNQAQFSNDDEGLTDEMIASWRDRSSGRDFSWND